MVCEHNTLRPAADDETILFCVDCGHRTAGRNSNIRTFSALKPKPPGDQAPEVARIELFLNSAEANYLMGFLNRKLFGINKVLKAERSLEARGEQEMIANAKASYKIVEPLFQRLRSLIGA